MRIQLGLAEFEDVKEGIEMMNDLRGRAITLTREQQAVAKVAGDNDALVRSVVLLAYDLLASVLNRYPIKGTNLMEAVEMTYVFLMEAIATWDESKGALTTWVWHSLSHRLLRWQFVEAEYRKVNCVSLDLDAKGAESQSGDTSQDMSRYDYMGPYMTEHDVCADPQDVVEDEDFKRYIMEQSLKMTDAQREVFHLYVSSTAVAGNQTAIAKTLGISLPAVHYRLRGGLRKLDNSDSN